MIENNILAITNAMFKNKSEWQKVSDDQKGQFFFIINRYFAKKYFVLAEKLNNLNQNKSTAMDLWFHFMSDKPYPQWFWTKSKKKSEIDYSDNDFYDLRKKYDLKTQEFEFLIKHHKEEIIEELEYLKKTKK